MTDDELDIGLATPDDVAGILVLQDANQADRGGTLSARLPRQWFEQTIAEMPVVVARRGGKIVGYAVTSSIEAQLSIPIVQAMMKVYDAPAGSYIYGPVCVAETERQRGVASAMVAALRARLPGRNSFSFIRADNAPSLTAHTKMGMRVAAEFSLGDVGYVVVDLPG